MATQQQLKNKAAKRLGILATGQTLSGTRDELLQSAYNSLYDRMQRNNQVIWAKEGDIPDAYLSPLSALLAFESVDDVGVSDSRYVRIQNAVKQARIDIRSFSATPYVSTSEPKDF